MSTGISCEYISWVRFYSLSRVLSRRIQNSGFRPDCIVAIGRGGYIPARIISDFLHIMNLTSFKVEHYHGTHINPSAVIRYPLSNGVEGKNVLLVDDVCDTGSTLELASKHIVEQMRPTEVKTAVLHYKKVSSFKPDFYAGRIVKWRWIIYPWALAEDISEFLKEMDSLTEDTSQILKVLARDYGVRIPAKILEDILAMSEILK